MYLRRVLMANLGHDSAFYRGSVFDFSNQEGFASNAATLASNGRGKTTMLSMVFSIFEPRKSQFVQTIQNAGHKFEEYLSEIPGIIAVELEDPMVRFPEPRRIVVGWIQTRVRQDSGSMRQFFSFPVVLDRKLDNLPWPGSAVDAEDHVRSWDDVVRFKKQWAVSRAGQPGATFIDNQQQWVRHLREDLGVPVELIIPQIQLCRTEGGLAELFKKITKNEHVLSTLTGMFGLDAEAAKVAEELRRSTQKLASRPIMERDIKALEGLYGRVATTNEKAINARAAETALDAAMDDLSEYGRFLQRHIQGLQTKIAADRFTVDQLSAGVATLVSEIQSSEARAEIFRVLKIEALLRAREADFETGKQEIRAIDIANAAIQLSGILTEINELKNKIEVKAETVRVMEEGAEIQIGPVKEAGSRYGLTLKRDMAVLHQKIVEMKTKMIDLQEQIDVTSDLNRESENTVVGLSNQLNMIASIETAVADILNRSEALRIAGESIPEAVERIEATHAENVGRLEGAEVHREESRRVLNTAIQRESDLVRRVRDADERHEAANAALETRMEENSSFETRDDVQLLFMGGSADPLASGTTSYLTEKLAAKKSNIARAQADLSEKTIRLEAYEKGLSRRDDNLQRALDVLAEKGITAHSAATYVSNTIIDADKAKHLVESDTGRLFHGIVVENVDDLERVRTLSPTDLKLDAPIHVSLIAQAHEVGTSNVTHVIMSPWSKAAYHKATLENDKAFLKEEIDALTARLKASLNEQTTIQRIFDLHKVLISKEHDVPLHRLQLKEQETREIRDQLEQELEEARENVGPCRAAVEDADQAHSLARAQQDQSSRQVHSINAFATGYLTETNKLAKLDSRPLIESKIADLNKQIAARQQQVSDLRKAHAALRAPVESLQEEMRDLDYAERSIAHRDENDHDITALTRDVAKSIYSERNASFQDEFKSLSHHQTELATYNRRLDTVTANFEAGINDADRRFEALDRDLFQEACQTYSAMSETARRQEIGLLADRRDRAQETRDAISSEIGALKTQMDQRPTELWKFDRVAFDDLASSIRLGHDQISADEAHRIMEECEFAASDLMIRHGSLKSEWNAAADSLQKLEIWTQSIVLEVRRSQMASAIASDTRPDDVLQFSFPEPQTIADVHSAVGEREAKITAGERRLTMLKAELIDAKQKLLTLCMDTSFGVLSATTVSSLEKYRKNALADVWHMEDIELQKIRTSIDAFIFAISKMEEDEERSISELSNLLTKCLAVFKRATNMRIPEKAGRFGGAQIMRCTFPFHQVTEESKRLTAKQHLDDMIERNRSDEGIVVEGAALVNGLLMKLAKVEGKNDGFKFKILVPVIQNESETYQDLAEMKGSGGQILTSAFLLYVLTASIRNETSGKQVGGVFLLLDNPLGAASAKELVQAQVQVAAAMNIQLVIVTPSNDSDPLSCFEVLNTLHLGRSTSRNRAVVTVKKESHNVLTAKHVFHLSEAA